MSKIKKFICVLFSALLIWGTIPLKESKADYDKSKYKREDPTTWIQQYAEGAQLPLGRNANGYTLGGHGCAVHSASAMYVKYGARKRGYIPKDFREEALKLNASGKTGGITDGGGMMWAGVSNQSNGYFANPTSLSNPSKAQLVDLLKKNYGIIAEVASKSTKVRSGFGTHYVFLDSVDKDGGIRIVDSGWHFEKLSQYGSEDSTVSIAWVYQPLKNKDAPSLYENKGNLSESGDKKDDKSEGKKSDSFILKEEDLVGLEKLQGNELEKMQESLDNLTTSFLTDRHDLDNASQMKERLESNKDQKRNRIVRMAISLFGWLMVLFSIIRLVVAIVDVRTGSKGYSLLNVGNKRVVKLDRGEVVKGEKTVTFQRVILHNAIMMLCGFLVLAGVLFKILLLFL